MSLIAHPSLASPHHQSSRADIAARSVTNDRFRSSLLASVSSTNHRQRLPSKSSSSYSSACKSPNDHQSQNQSGEGEHKRRHRRDVVLLPTFTALVLATSSSENAAHAMLVDESKSISAASTILEFPHIFFSQHTHTHTQEEVLQRERDERVVFCIKNRTEKERITEYYHTRRPSFFETEEDIPRDGGKKTFVNVVVIFLSTVARLV